MVKTWTLVVLLLFSNLAYAGKRSLRFDTGRSGLGGILGKPGSVRYNYWLNWKRSIFLDAGYNWEQVAVITFSYAFYFYDVKDLWKAKNKTNALMFYLAPGVFTGYNLGTTDPSQTIYLGGRAVGGVEYLFAGMPLSLRAEVGPAVYALGKTIGGIQGGVGFTYYFGSTKDSMSKEEAADAELDSGASGSSGDGDLENEFGEPAKKPTPKATSDESSLEDEFNSAPTNAKTPTGAKTPTNVKAPTKVGKPPAKKTKAPPSSKEDLSEFN